MTLEAENLVRSATAYAEVPFVPEVTLLTAAEPFGLWDRTRLDAPPFWAFPWAGGQGLARYVLDHPETVAGRHVLDVASGSGLVAIAAAKAGARTVAAGDIDDNALAAIALNAAANDTPQVTPCHVDLVDFAAAALGAAGRDTPGQSVGITESAAGQGRRDRDEGHEAAPRLGTATVGRGPLRAAGAPRGPDVVLAADVFYQRELAALALAFLKDARRAGAAVLAADPARAFTPRSEFIPVLSYEIPVLTVLEDTPVKTVTIYSLP